MTVGTLNTSMKPRVAAVYRRQKRQPGLRDELAAALWQLRRERRWAAASALAYGRLLEETEALRMEMDERNELEDMLSKL